MKLTKEYYLELSDEGMTDKEIAYDHYISVCTLSRYKRTWGIVRHKRTAEEYFELFNQGLLDWQIAEKWGYSSPETLSRWKKKNNVDTTGKIRKDIKKEHYLEYKRQGIPDKQIAKLLGVSPYTLVKRKKEWNLHKNLSIEEYNRLKSIGVTDKGIAYRYKIQYWSLQRWKQRKGVS